ncbi:TIGR04149 family rSAM-modified RiPP [Bacteroides faecalis]|uniref:Uncharacterized protein n=1 Tax=Bacteroides faecalis TaxID=2447885 RepID=A0A401LZJ5_9BACE|nr:TIGR04149 family rSAM-modified RiPP [Bacteroides faecalis]GCB36864.1 hypothetical protein KGMB02408_38090 [Bacteroides faecalis]
MKLNKISLQNLSQAEMTKKEQSQIRGGGSDKLCPCAGTCACTGYVVSGSNYYDYTGTNMIGLDFDEVGVIGRSNKATGYSY